jgi:hypothetical protein
LGQAQCYSTIPLKPTAPGVCSDRASVMTAPTAKLQSPPTAATCPPGLHALHMQLPPHVNAPSWCLDAGITRTTAAWLPPPQGAVVGRPLPTSCHLRSTRRTCSRRSCTLPPHYRSRVEAVHSSSHSCHRAPATPLDPAIAIFPHPLSTAAFGAPPAPLTPPVALPELGGALQPHQPSQRQPADPSPTHPSAQSPSPLRACHGEPPAALRPKSGSPSTGFTPWLLPRRPTAAGRSNLPVSHRRRRGFPLPCLHHGLPAHAKPARMLGRLAEQAEPCSGLRPSVQYTFSINFRILLD